MALYGIYGRHEIDQCPWNNKERAKEVIEIANSDLASMLPNYKIHNIVGQYHSGLEHTFLWILDAEDPHLIQQFAVGNHLLLPVGHLLPQDHGQLTFLWVSASLSIQ